jgi:hypothetical protein
MIKSLPLIPWGSPVGAPKCVWPAILALSKPIQSLFLVSYKSAFYGCQKYHLAKRFLSVPEILLL